MDSQGKKINIVRGGQVYSGQKTVTSAGTAEALATDTPIKSVSIKALSTNTGNVYVGDSTVDSSSGFILDTSEGINLAIDNLNKVYIDVDTNGQGVSYIAIL